MLVKKILHDAIEHKNFHNDNRKKSLLFSMNNIQVNPSCNMLSTKLTTKKKEKEKFHYQVCFLHKFWMHLRKQSNINLDCQSFLKKK